MPTVGGHETRLHVLCKEVDGQMPKGQNNMHEEGNEEQV